ncbi:MAG: carbamoyl-phosphate synthase large subunit [Solitalea-like symbiont of Tyrophagus putrescentiae]
MPHNSNINTVLVIGSGPIIIGQSCEFDYSGSQALMSLKEEGISTIVINSNPATIMTDEIVADKVYLLPLTIESLEQILKKHKIDAVLPTVGGQTALNLCKEAYELGLWNKYNVEIIGVDIDVIDNTEDREKFRQLLTSLNLKTPRSQAVHSIEDGLAFVKEIGFPLVLRSSYTLGGAGGAFVKDISYFESSLRNALDVSPAREAMIEEALIGWKEFELELLRDKENNTVVICPIENVDPIGIHTGDSITTAPTLTISDTVYQNMRDIAIKLVKAIGNFSGGCNVQFAIDPETEEIIVIEMNPRVSRSSALASKATGYPIAKIAAKLAIGYTLDELNNQITNNTSAYFEPTIDYVVVKIPRWDFNKFPDADKTLGLQMKSIGEVMAIGRTFNEALQKAFQSLEISELGLYNIIDHDKETILKNLRDASNDRFLYIKQALDKGISVEQIHDLTKIDKWFLKQIEKLSILDKEIKEYNLSDVPIKLLKEAKSNGYSNAVLAKLLKSTESDIESYLEKQGIRRTYKMVDSCAAEFSVDTPYYYSSFDKENESVPSKNKKVVILGSGPNRIGQGIEFDYACVHTIFGARDAGYETIMINCNPETVSTDFNIADKLYFEPLCWEYIIDIIKLENPDFVIIGMGGQTSIKFAEKLYRCGIKVLGSNFKAIDLAENRGLFSQLLQENNILYPQYGIIRSANEAECIANKIGYPVLLRPNYVIGGAGVKIINNNKELKDTISNISPNSISEGILIDKFIKGAKEAEVDIISDGSTCKIIGIMEHFEEAGVHSGDSISVLPSYSLSKEVLDTIKEYSIIITKALNIVGFINIQFAIEQDKVYVIEANPRVSRTVPFISKAKGAPYVNIAIKMMLGSAKITDLDAYDTIEPYSIKIPVFSFDKFPGINTNLGPEMKSTGEAILFAKKSEDLYKILNTSGFNFRKNK